MIFKKYYDFSQVMLATFVPHVLNLYLLQINRALAHHATEFRQARPMTIGGRALNNKFLCFSELRQAII